MWSKRIVINCFIGIFILLAGCQSVPKQQAVEVDTSATAADETQSVSETSPADDLYQLAMWSVKADKLDDAIKHFRDLILLQPDYPKAYTNLGLALLQKNDWEAARETFISAIESDDKDAIALNHLAIVEREQGNFQQARNYYQQAIDADPEYANAYLNLGILLDIYLQDLKGALKLYETYQDKTDNSNKDIEKWVIDVQRRIDANAKKGSS